MFSKWVVKRPFLPVPSWAALPALVAYTMMLSAGWLLTAWASAYAARTILESVVLNRRDKPANTAGVFSPNFVYKNMFIFNGQPDDPGGQRGAAVSWALNFMRDRGPVKMLDRDNSPG